MLSLVLNKRQPLLKHCRCRRKEFLCQSIETVSEHFLKIKMKGTKPNLGIHIPEDGMKEGIIDDVNESDNSYKLQCDYQQIPLLLFFGNTTFSKAEKVFIPILNTRRKVIQTKKSLLTSKYLGAFTTYENIENIFTKWSITNKIFTAILVKKKSIANDKGLKP